MRTEMVILKAIVKVKKMMVKTLVIYYAGAMSYLIEEIGLTLLDGLAKHKQY